VGSLTVAVLGLGEAGGRIADDLQRAGLDVRGYDPATRPGDPCEAVTGSDVVLSLNSAAAAVGAARSILEALGVDAIYADLNTAGPELKRELAELVGPRFADVALLGTVPATGVRTPALASGPAGRAFADAFGPLGMPIEVVSEMPGDAAALKLVRSVFMKGIAAAAVESLAAADALGRRDWLERQLSDVLGEPLLVRLVEGSRKHAVRRADEMDAARELLVDLGVEPRVATASAALLADLAAR
jgi:3-hydroxyisobutyrate dehydrogenase-like beta-hydroxyacid dehydrogenase